jgi:hypothetical protein
MVDLGADGNPDQSLGHQQRIGREDVGSAFGPASPGLTRCGRRVRVLGPGLTSESADAVSGCLANDLSAGPQFLVPTGGAGLICPSWTRGRGSQVSGQRVRAIPSTSEKRWH